MILNCIPPVLSLTLDVVTDLTCDKTHDLVTKAKYHRPAHDYVLRSRDSELRKDYPWLSKFPFSSWIGLSRRILPDNIGNISQLSEFCAKDASERDTLSESSPQRSDIASVLSDVDHPRAGSGSVSSEEASFIIAAGKSDLALKGTLAK